jgi:hypothetical protein
MNWFVHAAARSVTLLTPIAWPIVVIMVVLLFRKQLSILLGRLKGAKGYGVEVVTCDVYETHELAAEFTNNVRDFLPSGNWTEGLQGEQRWIIQLGPEKAENFYFFSHNLMLCYTALLTGADSEIIIHTLRSAITHIEKFAKDSPYHLGLVVLLKQAEKNTEADWTEKRRRLNARKIWLISRNLGDKIQQISRIHVVAKNENMNKP